MPGFDRSGPKGIGPMTGWQRGACRATGIVDSEGAPRFGRGQGRGLGRGLGARRGMGQQRPEGQSVVRVAKEAAGNEPKSTAEMASLKKQYQQAAELLDAISKKIELLETGK